MAIQLVSRRIPWIALALSFLSAGVGHIYCGQFAKGLLLYFAWMLLPICVGGAMLLPPSTTSLVFLLMLPVAMVVAIYVYAAIDAWRTAARIGSDFNLRDYNRASVYRLLIVVQIVLAFGLIIGVRSFMYEAFIVPARSMSPTILAGDRVLARKLLPAHYFPERGDLIVFRNPERNGGNVFVKRVIAVSGDRIEVRGNSLSINGKKLERDRVAIEKLSLIGDQVIGNVDYEQNSGRRYLVSYEQSPSEEGKDDHFETTVAERHVFVMGDNRDHSKDSRHFGAIHVGDIVGNVDYIFWPAESWSRFGAMDGKLP